MGSFSKTANYWKFCCKLLEDEAFFLTLRGRFRWLSSAIFVFLCSSVASLCPLHVHGWFCHRCRKICYRKKELSLPSRTVAIVRFILGPNANLFCSRMYNSRQFQGMICEIIHDRKSARLLSHRTFDNVIYLNKVGHFGYKRLHEIERQILSGTICSFVSSWHQDGNSWELLGEDALL